ncbi:MAG TPA: hypothetical protein VEU29_03365 [Actinomycetota bacterium]|nr:hypothetical protein [Actinomycetota bacterium]
MHLFPTLQSFDTVERVLDDLDLGRAFEPLRESLGDDWDFVLDYVRGEVRASLELGMMVRALLDLAESRGHVSPVVSEWFRSNQTFRSRNFGVADQLDARFMRLALGDRGSGLLTLLEQTRQRCEAILFADGGLGIVNPPPPGKRQLIDLP